MKILNIFTSNLRYDGIGMSNLNYYNNISDEFIIDYLVPNKVEESLKERFSKKGNKIFELDYNGKKMHQVRPILYCKKIYDIIKKENYDIVQVHGSSSMMFLQLLTAKIAGVKIRIAHSRNTKSDHKIIHYILKPLFKISYNVAFACGNDAGKWLFGKKEVFTIIPNGKNIEKFKFNNDLRNNIRKEYNLNNKIVLGHIGNFNFQKNHEFLIEVFYNLCKENDNYILMLAGTGFLEDMIKDKVRQYNLEDKVIFLGQVSNEKIAQLLNSMDIMLFPSKFEGFPNVLIEWQINGLPCLISNQITKDVKIIEQVQFLPIDDYKEWVDKINNISLMDRAICSEGNIKKIRNAGYDISENAEALEKKYIELYKSLILK